MKKIFTLLSLSLIITAAKAQIVMGENFDYSTGALTTAGGANVSGGNWVTNTGTGNFLQVTAGSLSYPNYHTNPAPGSNKLSTVATGSSAEDAYRAFTSQTTGTVYGSALVQVNDLTTTLANTDANGDYVLAFLPSTSTSNYTARVMFRKGVGANTVNIGIRSHTSAPTSWAPADYPTGQALLIIFGYEFISGATNDVAKLWVNPAYSATEPAPLATHSFVGGPAEPADITRFGVRQGTTTPGVDIDAIKVSTSWSAASLPLSLLSFTATLSDNKVNVNWTTANEVNVAGYEVERSVNGKDFMPISMVNAENGSSTKHYTYVDPKAVSGTSYYRLKMNDKDGSYKYSQIVPVKNSIIGVSLYPNPVKSAVTIQHESAEKGATVSIVGMNGKQLVTVNVQAGAVQTTIEAAKLAPGAYMVIYTNNGNRQTKQFIKE